MDIKSSEITPEHVYLSRREFIKSMGFIGGAAILAACRPKAEGSRPEVSTATVDPPGEALVDEKGSPVTTGA